MKQIIQDLSSGDTILEDVPVPRPQPGQVLIRTHRSLVSLGTERMLVEFGKANWIDKARQQPEKVKQVMEKVRTDGLRPTMEAVFRKLGEPLPLGYCNAGEVIALGEGVDDLQIGDRVVSNGHHAEVVSVPRNLVARIPDGVSYEEASFTVIGAIALQGIRLIRPTYGETIVVTGLGLIGLIAAQLLHANGCEVVGLDVDPAKVRLAREFGVQAFTVSKTSDPVALVQNLTRKVGADGVLITASTKSNEVIAQAARMSRKRGRIVLVGVIGLDLQRADFYEKELSFQVSCSYGPGRYDDTYEQKGQDYPLPYVRWTEQRNFEAVLQSIATGRLRVKPLITEEVPLAEYRQIYGDMGASESIASILVYPGQVSAEDTTVNHAPRRLDGQRGVLGIIGAGNFTKSTIMPALKKHGAAVRYIASARGLSATTTAKKFGVERATTDYADILRDPEVDAVLITTRHHLHADQVIQSLQAGKHVFVEKPLALSHEELDRVDAAYRASDRTLTVGFNRRFSPFALDAREKLGEGGAINVIANMNAGYLPPEVWVHDPEVGGGRIIGEACHLIDLITFFTGSLVEQVVCNALGPDARENTDNASILLRYQNGSQGVINYFANGSKAYAKERVEIYDRQRTVVIDNYRRSHYYGLPGRGLRRSQDKGHTEQFRLFLERLRQGGEATIPYEQIMNTSRAAIAAIDSLREGTWIRVD